MADPMADPVVAEVGAEATGVVLGLVRAAYLRRPDLDPPSTYITETESTVASSLARSGGLVCRVSGTAVGAVLLEDAPGELRLRRLAVLPTARHRGVGTALVRSAESVAGSRGHDDVTAEVRTQLADVRRFWARLGYAEVGGDGRGAARVRLGKALGTSLTLPTASDTRDAARRLAPLCRPGDVLVLTGELGAGKTTFTQGLAAGLAVRGDVTSPTFVISRLHPSLVGGPALLHVDAYRLGGGAELDDLDLDAYVDSAVTVVEWGAGIAESLSTDRLAITLTRDAGPGGCDGVGGAFPVTGPTDPRSLEVVAHGARWYRSGLRSVLLGAATGVRPEPRATASG